MGIICGPGIICGTVWGSFAVLGSFADPYRPFFLNEIFEKVSFDPYNFRITRLSAGESEQMKNF